jgi:hypothetical protein
MRSTSGLNSWPCFDSLVDRETFFHAGIIGRVPVSAKRQFLTRVDSKFLNQKEA